MASNPIAPAKDKKGKKKFDTWEIEDMGRTVIRAGEILCDPEKMKHVKKHLKKQKQAFKSIEDLVKYKNEKYGGDAEAEESEE